MKRLFILILCVEAFGGGYRLFPLGESGKYAYPLGINPEDQLEVLGISGGKSKYDSINVAFRHVYTLAEDQDETGKTLEKPAECDYPGLPKKTSGMILGIYDGLRSQVNHWYPVYPSVFDKKKCRPLKEAKREKTRAFQKFSKLGIPVSEKLKPASTSLEKIDPGSSITIDNQKYILFNTRLIRLQEKEQRTLAEEKILDAAKDVHTGKCEFPSCQISIGAVLDEKRERVLWVRFQQDHYTMASGGTFEFKEAYRVPAGLVFHLVFDHRTNHGGGYFSRRHIFASIF